MPAALQQSLQIMGCPEDTRVKRFSSRCTQTSYSKLWHYLWAPGVAFCTAELKKASLKKSREPLKMTRALFLAWRPAIRRVFFPTAWGYWGQKGQVTWVSPKYQQSYHSKGTTGWTPT